MTASHWPPFYMIRHGETDWNRESRYQGRVDIPINARGRGQAAGNGRLLAKMERDWSGWLFVASPLGRARETMEIIRGEMGLDPSGYETDDRLIEISFGRWERRRLEELERDQPDEMALRNADKWAHVPPGGESYAQTVERVQNFLDSLAQPAVIVCHGGILRSTRYLLEGGDGRAIVDTAVPQDKIYCFDGKRSYWSDQDEYSS